MSWNDSIMDLVLMTMPNNIQFQEGPGFSKILKHYFANQKFVTNMN